MKQIHLNRLKKLADHLESGKLGHKRFDFSQYNSGTDNRAMCGTIGCAMGETPIIFPEHFKFDEITGVPILYTNNAGATDSGMLFFSLSYNEYNHLFVPHKQFYNCIPLSIFATKEQVAENMIRFIKIRCEALNIPFDSLNTEEV